MGDDLIHLFDPATAEKTAITEAPANFAKIWEPMQGLSDEKWYKDAKSKLLKDKPRYKGFVAPAINVDIFDTSRLNKYRAAELEMLRQEQDTLGGAAQTSIEGYCALSDTLIGHKDELEPDVYDKVISAFKHSKIGECTKLSLQLMANRFNVVTKARRSLLTKALLPDHLKNPFYIIKPAQDFLFDKTEASALVTNIGNAQKFREVTSPKPFRGGSHWRGGQSNRGGHRGGFNDNQSSRGKRPFSGGNNQGQKRGRGGSRGARGAPNNAGPSNA